jgi:hypothetical protein
MTTKVKVSHTPVDRCPYCSFDPTSMSDYCAEHRPDAVRTAYESEMGADWVTVMKQAIAKAEGGEP